MATKREPVRTIDLGFAPDPCPHCGGRVRRFIPPESRVKMGDGTYFKFGGGKVAKCFSCMRDVTAFIENAESARALAERREKGQIL